MMIVINRKLITCDSWRLNKHYLIVLFYLLINLFPKQIWMNQQTNGHILCIDHVLYISHGYILGC